MEHSCIIFRHGGYPGYRNASLLNDAPLPSHQAPTLARERWIKLFVLALGNFDERVDISCRFDEMTEYI